MSSKKKHDIAPNAALLFRLQPQQSGVTLADVTLKLTDGATSYPLTVVRDGTFSLPRVPAVMKEDTVLELNRKKTQVRWRPYIVTPGMAANIREGRKSEAVYIQRSTSAYVPPIADESWGNDAVMEFNFL